MKNHIGISKVGSLLLFGLGILGLLLIFLSENISFSIGLFSLYSLCLVLRYNDRTFTQPVLVFTLFYYPYSTWYLFQILSVHFYNIRTVLLVLQYSYVGLFAFASVSLLFEIKFSSMKNPRKKRFVPEPVLKSPFLFNSAYWVTALLIVFYILTVFYSGALSKRDIADAKMSMTSIAGFSAFFLTILIAMYKINDVGRKGRFCFRDPLMFTTLGLLVLYYLVAGERDYMFRYIFIMIMIYFHSEKSANILKLLPVFIGTILVMPVSQAFKTILLSKPSTAMSVGEFGIFGGEFAAASRNLYMVIYYDAKAGYSYLLNDFLRGVIPFSSSFGLESFAHWYDTIFRIENGVAGTSGWGSSLVAEGFVVDGARGVFVVMFMVSCMLHTLHKLMYRSIYWYVFYLLALSTSIYCIRADVANFVSQTFKISGLAIAALWFCTVLLKKVLRSRRRSSQRHLKGRKSTSLHEDKVGNSAANIAT